MFPLLMNLIPTVYEGVFWVDPVVNMYSGIEPGSHTRNPNLLKCARERQRAGGWRQNAHGHWEARGKKQKILGHYSEITSPSLLKRFFGTTWAIPWHFFGTTRPPLVILLVTVGVAFLLLSFFSILLIVLRRPILSWHFQVLRN